MLDKNDKNKFKPQNVYGHIEIALIQHTLLENENPDRGRKRVWQHIHIVVFYVH